MASASAVKPSATKRAIEVAEEHGINVEEIPGTGKDGKVTVDDVRAAVDELLDYEEPQLTEAGMRIYMDVKAYLEEFELWKPVFKPLLERYVQNLTRANWARRKAESRPTTKGSTKQTVANPMFGVARNAELDAHKYAQDLLITPKALKEHLQGAGESGGEDDLGF